MLLRKPDFYNKFECIASKCSDTCCMGWEIDIDENSQQAYRKVKGAFGDKLRENIVDGHFKLLPHDRCPFLNKENLCEIYRNLGAGALCDICREHPRFVEVYGDIMERGLGLCCEEATRLLLKGEDPLTFTNEECDEPEEKLDEDDIEIRNEVLYTREQIFSILADKDSPLNKRLHEAFGLSSENAFAPLKSASDYFDILNKTISFGSAWDNALERIKVRVEALSKECDEGNPPANLDEGFFSETESVRLLAYIIYRHYAKCLFDGYEQGKTLFAPFFWNTVRFFTRELAGVSDNNDSPNYSPERIKIDAIKLLSRQLEYCEENMQLIESTLDE